MGNGTKRRKGKQRVYFPCRIQGGRKGEDNERNLEQLKYQGMKYKVKIEEVLAKYVEVEAESPRKAKNLVRQMYFDEEIQLGSDYLIETNFETVID